jgi:hypothetical protein
MSLGCCSEEALGSHWEMTRRCAGSGTRTSTRCGTGAALCAYTGDELGSTGASRPPLATDSGRAGEPLGRRRTALASCSRFGPHWAKYREKPLGEELEQYWAPESGSSWGCTWRGARTRTRRRQEQCRTTGRGAGFQTGERRWGAHWDQHSVGARARLGASARAELGAAPGKALDRR